MYLGAYDFDGDPDVLLAAYDRLPASLPPDMVELQVCIVRGDGITVFDACPSAEVFASLSRSPEFRGAVAKAGLPDPAVHPLGSVHAARMRSS